LIFCNIFITSGKIYSCPRENGDKSNKIKNTERKTYVKSFGINTLKGSVILEITLPFVFIIITLKKEKIRRK